MIFQITYLLNKLVIVQTYYKGELNIMETSTFFILKNSELKTSIIQYVFERLMVYVVFAYVIRMNYELLYM